MIYAGKAHKKREKDCNPLFMCIGLIPNEQPGEHWSGSSAARHTETRMPTLLEIGSELTRLNALLDLTDGEVTPEIDAEIAAVLADLDGKADGYASLIRERELRSKAREEEAERLAKLATTDRNLAKSLRERLKLVMEGSGQKRIETPRFRISVCQNGGKLPIDVHEPVPPTYCRAVPDMEAIRHALEAGEQLQFAALGERGSHLRIS